MERMKEMEMKMSSDKSYLMINSKSGEKLKVAT